MTTSQGETLIATLTAREGQEEALLERLAALVAPTGAEPGAVEYQVHRGAPGTRTVIVYERYADDAALEAHVAFASAVRSTGVRGPGSFWPAFLDALVSVG